MGIQKNFSPKMEAYADKIQELLTEAHYSAPLIEVLDNFIPPANVPNSSIEILVKSPETRPTYADALASALTNVADKVSGASIPDKRGDFLLNTNDVMIFISGFR